jgi:hypothetical protein
MGLACRGTDCIMTTNLIRAGAGQGQGPGPGPWPLRPPGPADAAGARRQPGKPTVAGCSGQIAGCNFAPGTLKAAALADS